MKFYEEMLDGSLKLHIKAMPGSSKLKFGEVLETGEIKLHLTEQPENGKANKQLIAFLAKFFGTAKSNIILEKGEFVQHKIIIITNVTRVAMEKLLDYSRV